MTTPQTLGSAIFPFPFLLGYYNVFDYRNGRSLGDRKLPAPVTVDKIIVVKTSEAKEPPEWPL
jgi:hypothetical protein